MKCKNIKCQKEVIGLGEVCVDCSMGFSAWQRVSCDKCGILKEPFYMSEYKDGKKYCGGCKPNVYEEPKWQITNLSSYNFSSMAPTTAGRYIPSILDTESHSSPSSSKTNIEVSKTKGVKSLNKATQTDLTSQQIKQLEEFKAQIEAIAKK